MAAARNRKKPTTGPNLLQQIVAHMAKNGLTTMLGITTGVPMIIDGYTAKNWQHMFGGFADVILGVSGSDRFGIAKSTAPAPGAKSAATPGME